MLGATCPRCRHVVTDSVRFCSRCGLYLEGIRSGAARPGCIPHPAPLTPPPGSRPCTGCVDLYVRWEAAWGAPLLTGAEPLRVHLFNAGYPLMHLVLRLRGADTAGQALFDRLETIRGLPRGAEETIEVSSYDLPRTLTGLEVHLDDADFGPDEKAV